MRRTKRVKKGKRKTRRMRGGRQIQPCDIYPRWPPIEGCEKQGHSKVILPVGTLIDRIGHEYGSFVSFLQKNLEGNAKPPSFSSRALRILGENTYMYNINGVNTDLRKLIYGMVYAHANDPDNNLYYVLEVTKEIICELPCRAAAAFDYEGGAFQVKLPHTIDELLKGDAKKGIIQSLKKYSADETSTLFGGIYFPPYEDPEDKIPGIFETYNSSLSDLVEYYYGTSKAERDANRERLRRERGLAAPPSSPAAKAAVAVKMATVIAPKMGDPISPLDKALLSPKGPLSPLPSSRAKGFTSAAIPFAGFSPGPVIKPKTWANVVKSQRGPQ